MASHTKFPVEVLTPEGEVFNDEVEMVSTRTGVGSIGILANHTPLLAMVDPTELRLYTSENDYTAFAQGEGYVQVAEGRVLLLVEEATPPGDLDASSLRDRLSEAEKAVAVSEEGTEEERKARRDVRRWETFLSIADGGGSGS